MTFSSTIFLFLFLPITLLIYYLLKGGIRNYWLLLCSLIFFAWAQPEYLWIIILSIFINYSSALLLQFDRLRKVIIVAMLIANLGLLFYFKYFDFLLESISNLTKFSFNTIGIVLPIGISFFTFQGISYVIDVYRQTIPVQKNPFKLGLYIALFPQLIAGPIVRYVDIVEEIDTRTVTFDDFIYGIERFIIGLGKKSIIANTMALLADSIWEYNGYNISAIAWLGSIAYTLQIFYDFSGYSDMAIGLGRMFGFKFNENFNLPYISKSISEFWRRWHISLSSWFRDYVYIPLGGNRKHVYRNTTIVFVLTGIWHGAAWNFMAWGIFNLCFLILERIYNNSTRTKKEDVTVSNKIVGSIYTLFVINIGWVIFRAPTLTDAILYFKNMFINIEYIEGVTIASYLSNWNIFVLFLGILFASNVPTRIKVFLEKKLHINFISVLKYVMLVVVFLVSILRVVSGTYNPFIYFRF